MFVGHRRLRRRLRSVVLGGTLVLGLGLLVPAWTAQADGGTPTQTVVGTMVRAWTEHKNPRTSAEHGKDDLLSFVQLASGQAVRVPTQQVTRLPEGAKVAVTVGKTVTDAATSEDGAAPARQVVSSDVVAPAPFTPASPAPSAPLAPDTPAVTDQVTVVMEVPAGGTQDATTLSQVVSAVNGDVATFWAGQSGGAVQIGVTGQVDWFQATSTCSNPYGLWTEAAQRAGWSRGPGKHLLVYLPGTSTSLGCAYGLGEVGSSLTSGGLLYVTATAPSVIAHELGHNFGLEHSSQEQCDATVDSGTCSTTPYMDLYDVMGASWDQLGSLSVAQAAHLNFLPAAQTTALTMSDAETTVSLSPVSGTTGTRAVKMTAPDGTLYWLEYRPANLQDSWLGLASRAARQYLEPGVLLRRWTTSNDDEGDGSLLLDGSPSGQASWYTDSDETLPVGASVRFAGGTFTVRVTAADASTATVDVTPTSPVTMLHDTDGGDTGSLGAATGAEVCTSRMCSRSYQHGVIDWSITTGAHAVTDPVLTAWNRLGGNTGWMGLPTHDLVCGLARGGCLQQFQGGVEYWSPTTGTHAVNGALFYGWGATGWEGGWLGYPTGDAICGLARGGCLQQFQNGVEYWSPASGAHPVNGALFYGWGATGWEGGWLGYPTANAVCGLAQGGCLQQFQNGVEYWAPSTGAHPVNGALFAAWGATGWEHGWLGYPTTNAVCGLVRGGCLQQFQAGVEYWSPASGAHAVSGALFWAWGATGWEHGRLGYPVTDAACSFTGCTQSFQGGRLTWTSRTGRVTPR